MGDSTGDAAGLARTARLDARGRHRHLVSHHHLDHTVNIALFPEVPVHDFRCLVVPGHGAAFVPSASTPR